MNKKILVLLIAALVAVATPPMTSAVWAKYPSVVGSPYDNYRSPGNIFTRTGRGIKKGFIKIKNGFVWTGQKIKGSFTQD